MVVRFNDYYINTIDKCQLSSLSFFIDPGYRVMYRFWDKDYMYKNIYLKHIRNEN